MDFQTALNSLCLTGAGDQRRPSAARDRAPLQTPRPRIRRPRGIWNSGRLIWGRGSRSRATLGPAPGYKARKGHFPGRGFSSRRRVAAAKGAGPGADSAACRPRGKACVAGPLRAGSASSSSEPRHDLAPARRNLSFSPMSLV